jgi:hypothetical protein
VSLLERMLAHEPADRPPTAAILKHPVFWSKVSGLSGLLVDWPPTAAILKHPVFWSKVSYIPSLLIILHYCSWLRSTLSDGADTLGNFL